MTTEEQYLIQLGIWISDEFERATNPLVQASINKILMKELFKLKQEIEKLKDVLEGKSI